MCPRCKEEKPLLYRVKSDLIDEIVCAQCSVAAKAMDLWVEKIDEKANRKNSL